MRPFLRTLKLHLTAATAGTRSAASTGPETLDLVFVTPPKAARGWILEAICRELAQRLPHLRVGWCAAGEPLPSARRYFFSHYMYYVSSLRPLRSRPGQCFVFATHLEPEKHRIGGRLLAKLLASSDGLICMNGTLREELMRLGVPARKLSVVVGAADASQFAGHARTADGRVGFCSAFYERKSPDLILDIVRAMPHRRFLLLGHGWRTYRHFAQLTSLPNFEYLEIPYVQYPAHYAQMSVFVSASKLEGGPIPLLEAMMANVMPVASRTGFAPDVIEHGHNGLLFDLEASAGEICRLIDDAFEMGTDVRATVLRYDWAPFAHAIAAQMQIPLATPSQGLRR